MKKNIAVIMTIFFTSLSVLNAQVQSVKLTQTPGVFTTETVELAPGQYQFNIANENVEGEVGFVLVPKGKYDAADHIKAAYVTETVPTGGNSLTGVVDLPAGEYEYFCPMNPTPKYSLIVKEGVEKIRLGQVPGEFSVQGLTVSEGQYQFEILNDSVDSEVGFVLVPKGKYAPENHIKAAYVTQVVPTGESSLTGIVDLKAGEYEYFCPMNKTPKYSLTVK